MKKKIFIITGEYSGDIHAANVVKSLKQITSDYIFEGIGGDNLKAQGVKLFEHSKNLSAMGISPKIIINHYKLGKRVVEYLKTITNRIWYCLLITADLIFLLRNT